MTDAPVALLVLLAVLGFAAAAALSAGEIAVVRVSRAAVAELVMYLLRGAETVRRAQQTLDRGGLPGLADPSRKRQRRPR